MNYKGKFRVFDVLIGLYITLYLTNVLDGQVLLIKSSCFEQKVNMSARSEHEREFVPDIETNQNINTLRRRSRVPKPNIYAEEGVQQERLVYLDKCKSGALSAVTAKRNEIELLWHDTNNYSLIKEKATALTELFKDIWKSNRSL